MALLGTQFTMEQGFYKQRLADKFSVDVLIPDAQEREIVHRVIYDELCKGIINPESKAEYLTIIDNLTKQGAESIILGCTEIALLVQQSDASIPLLDSTALHCAMALKNSLK